VACGNLPGNDILASFALWLAEGLPVAIKAVETWQPAQWAIDAGGDGVVRYIKGPLNAGDCANPAYDPIVAVQDQVARHLPYAMTHSPPDRGFWLEVSNECDTLYWEVGGVEWTRDYMAREIEVFSQYYPSRFIFGSFLHGRWTRERVFALGKVWDMALEYDACLGIHSYTLPINWTDGVYWSVEDALQMGWLYPFVWEHRAVRFWLMELDPKYKDVRLCITEFGVGGGHMPWMPDEYAAFMAQVYGYDPVEFVAGYSAGASGPYPLCCGMMADTARLWP
jgi:hypothetical protein